MQFSTHHILQRWWNIKKFTRNSIIVSLFLKSLSEYFLEVLCHGSHQSWKVLKFEKSPGKSWNFAVKKRDLQVNNNIFRVSLYVESSNSLTKCFDFHLRCIGCNNVYIYGVIQTFLFFLGGGVAVRRSVITSWLWSRTHKNQLGICIEYTYISESMLCLHRGKSERKVNKKNYFFLIFSKAVTDLKK